MERHSTSFGAGDKQQHTLAGEVCFEGVTLHKGFHGKLLIKPALSNHGIVFKRTDLKASENLVRARWDNVSDTALCTTVSNESGISVSTIEHLMAALLVAVSTMHWSKLIARKSQLWMGVQGLSLICSKKWAATAEC